MLRALVAMEDKAAVVWRTLPANRPPYRGREIEPPFSRGHARDAARPKSAAPARGESALCQVQPRASRLGLLLNAAFSGRAPSGKPGLPHDAGHAILAHGDTALSQLAVDAPAAAAALVPLEGLDDEHLEASIGPHAFLMGPISPLCPSRSSNLTHGLGSRRPGSFFSSSFSRSSSSTFFSGFTVSWSLLTLGEPLPGNASSPISSRSRAHLLSVESFMPSSSDRSLTVISPDRTTFAAETLNCLSYRFLLWVILNTFRP